MGINYVFLEINEKTDMMVKEFRKLYDEGTKMNEKKLGGFNEIVVNQSISATFDAIFSSLVSSVDNLRGSKLGLKKL